MVQVVLLITDAL